MSIPPASSSSPTSVPTTIRPSDVDPVSGTAEDERITFDSLFRPLARSWYLVAGSVVLALALGAAYLTVRGERYEARATLLAITGGTPTGIGEGLASSLLNVAAGGVQATPALLLRLAELDGVMREIAYTPLPFAPSERVIDRLVQDADTRRQPGRAADAVRDAVDVEADRQTGVVSVRVSHGDSALARFLVDQTVATLRATFTRASRSQAAELRQAQESRVAVSRDRLRTAESALVKFLSANRGISAFSSASITRQSLERDISIAQSVYMQAVTEMEAARSRELEQTPAVLVLDPLPEELPRVPRRTPLVLALAVVLGLVVGAVLALLRDAVRGARTSREAEAGRHPPRGTPLPLAEHR